MRVAESQRDELKVSSRISTFSNDFIWQLMVCSEVQPWKISLPIVLTESGMSMVCSEVQSLKAPIPIILTESGMSIFCRDWQCLKASLPISVTESGM